MILKQLNVLATLAAADGDVDQTEIDLIHKIGKSNGLDREQIDSIIDAPEDVSDFSDLNADERFDLLYWVIQLTKIDHKVFNEELLYTQQVASKLGYPLEAVMELYPHVNTHLNLSIPGEKAALKKKLDKIINAQ